MAQKLDKDTRLIDIDLGPLGMLTTRVAGNDIPATLTQTGNGQKDLINFITPLNSGTGSFIQYQRIDLSFMTQNNEVMMPVDISVQRTSPVPLGYNNNGNNAEVIEEYLYIFTRPLNNENLGPASPYITNVAEMSDLRHMGLDRTEGTNFSAPFISGNAGWPSLSQCIFAEKRMYNYSSNLGMTVTNGELTTPVAPAPLVYNTLMGMPSLASVTTWGSLGAITGPNLHCYRIVMNRNQTLINLLENTNLALGGEALCEWPAVSVQILCKDPNFTEGEYLTRVANAMNNIAEGGATS